MYSQLGVRNMEGFLSSLNFHRYRCSIMDYDYTFTYNNIKFGVITGKKGLLIVKTGSGGNIYGYENKYLLLSEHVNQRYDFSVIVSDNPQNISPLENFNTTLLVAERYNLSFNCHDIYYFGVSKGASYAAMYAYKYNWVTKWLAVNMPIFINWHLLKDGLDKLNAPQKMFVLFGTNDPSYRYNEVLDLVKGNVSKGFIPDIDHNFKNSTDKFIEMLDEYIFSN